MRGNSGIYLIVILLLLLPLITPSHAQDVEIDFKTTRISAKVYEDGHIETGSIEGTITNYGAQKLIDARVEIKITSSGATPVEPEGGGNSIEVFQTKAIYHLGDVKSGETKDFGVSISITDITISKIDYEILVKVKNLSGGYNEIYRSSKTLPVELYGAKAVSPVHSVLAEISSVAYKKGVDSWAEVKITVKNAGDYYENDLSLSIQIFDSKGRSANFNPKYYSLHLPPNEKETIVINLDGELTKKYEVRATVSDGVKTITSNTVSVKLSKMPSGLIWAAVLATIGFIMISIICIMVEDRAEYVLYTIIGFFVGAMGISYIQASIWGYVMVEQFWTYILLIPLGIGILFAMIIGAFFTY